MATYRKTKSGKFEFFVYMGRDSNGRKIKETKTFDKKKEGERWARDKEIEKETGILMEFANMTFSQFISKWLEEFVAPNLSPVTYDQYAYVFNNQVLPVLGRFKMKELQPSHLQTYLAKISKDGGSMNKQKNHYKIMSSALSYADEMNYIHINPIRNVRKPGKYSQQKITKKKKVVKAMGRDLIVEWFDYLSEYDEWLADYTYIALNTGMCLSEMLGSRWEDISFNDMTIRVEEVKVTKRGNGTITKGPKSENRYRLIPMSEELADRYRSIWRKQQESKQELGNTYQDNNLIMAKLDGSCYSPDGVSQKILRARRNKNFPEWISSHTFRHTFASLYLAEKPNIKELQVILGHHSYKITSDTYSHFLPDDFKKAGQTISKAVSSIFEKKSKYEGNKNKEFEETGSGQD